MKSKHGDTDRQACLKFVKCTNTQTVENETVSATGKHPECNWADVRVSHKVCAARPLTSAGPKADSHGGRHRADGIRVHFTDAFSRAVASAPGNRNDSDQEGRRRITQNVNDRNKRHVSSTVQHIQE
ncbi:hypothetical protein Q5P01_022903 [Channa striata]|uniref:Uncharacterized protein n=1 Tax=Channa striata TaxID=64152 RepID=A0AA88LRT3_CHASR|nr:hypothetical protein Q5P01_022903 [Channa striata]